MNKLLEIVLGLIILVGGISVAILNVWGVGYAMIELLKGGLGWLIILIGAILLIMGISDLKD